MLSLQLIIILSLLLQNVSISKGHLQASHIKYVKGSVYLTVLSLELRSQFYKL